MSLTVEQKLAEALALPREDRAFLARQLIVSLDERRDADAETEWREVIDRRTREMREGKASAVSTQEVLRRIRARLDANRKTS